MKANLDLDEHQMRIAAEEEKKRRRELAGPIRFKLAEQELICQTMSWPTCTLSVSWLQRQPVSSSKLVGPY